MRATITNEACQLEGQKKGDRRYWQIAEIEVEAGDIFLNPGGPPIAVEDWMMSAMRNGPCLFTARRRIYKESGRVLSYWILMEPKCGLARKMMDQYGWEGKSLVPVNIRGEVRN